MLVLQIAVLVTAVYAFVHAALQRPDAYTAAEKLTKPVWLVILGLAVALTSILSFVFGVLGMAVAACAAGVYLVDVRPKLLEIQGKSRWRDEGPADGGRARRPVGRGTGGGSRVGRTGLRRGQPVAPVAALRRSCPVGALDR